MVICPYQDVACCGAGRVGALLEGLLGPLAPQAESAREAVQTMTLFALRGLASSTRARVVSSRNARCHKCMFNGL